MELKWLEDFLAVNRLRNFSKAAASRNVTQPAFSRRIQALENWLGVPLFDRSVVPIELTRYGEEFLGQAHQILCTALEAQQDFRTELAANKKLVRISTLHTLSIHLVPRLVAPFLARAIHSSVEISSSIQGVDAHFDALDSGAAHILVVYANGWHQGRRDLLTMDVGQDCLIPVVSREHAEQWGLPDLEKGDGRLPIISYPPFTFSHGLIQPILDRLGERANIRASSSLGETQRSLVAQGAGIAWLLASSIRSELAAGHLLRCAGNPDRFSRPVRLVALRRADLSHPIAERFWSELPKLAHDAQSA